ncbi:SusC/RagA family TonB-linked outer membrane protein [Saccharicrinis sp. FJH54]|uniref:SusC/RagA family TonB-linked outer membrane protein n=1 Tax=Saccharicrinis sp. FJH54 TaxID=3344665 RepID=UPI0035D4AE23
MMNQKSQKRIMANGMPGRHHRFALILLLMLSGLTAFGQSIRTISGTVTSAADKAPVPGVNVIIKGTTMGAITNADGVYTIKAKNGDVLSFSFIGFETKDVTVSGQDQIDVVLQENMSEFDELVVVGYGVQQKKLVTGATVQIDGDAIEKTSTTGFLQAMQGQTAGVNITSTSGQPGEGLKVNIRGVGTIGNAGPLYVVDGVQSGDISYLNNADIESVDILKDAASAAIYGSQAANGVILITTKQGKKGKTSMTFDSYYGVQNVARQVDLLNEREYAVIMNEAAINNGKLPYFTMDEINGMGSGTNWIDEMLYKNAVTQNYALGLNGGSDASTYSMSLSYTGQEGVVGGPSVSDYNRYVFRINTEHNLLNDYITIGQHMTFSYTDKKGISVGNQYNNTFRGAFNTSPILPMYDDNGNFLDNTPGAGVMYNGEEWEPWVEGENNPYAAMVYNNQELNRDQKLFGDVYMDIKPFKGFSFRTRLGVDYYAGKSRSFNPVYQLSIYSFRLHDQAGQGMNNGLALTWDNYATYKFNAGSHDMSVMAGMSSYQNRATWMNLSNADLNTSDFEHAYINATTNTDLTLLSYGGGPNAEDLRLSYFGRFSWNYLDKYMLNATFRADGSSKFAEGNRWGYFPSVSAGWVLSNESFAENLNNWLDFFKLRASWGQVGNQNIGAWQYVAPISIGSANYYFESTNFDASGNTVGAYPSRLANPDVRWETSEQTNIGFDARFINAKLGVNFDWYDKTTLDWLIEKPGFATDGANPPYFNGGDVTNTGVEVAVSWNDNAGKFNYWINANIAKNKNIVNNVPTEDGIIHGLTNQLFDNAGEFYRRAESGYPIGYFWGLETDGVFQTEAEVASYRNSEGKVIQPNAKPGDLKFVDVDDNGVINDDDKGMVGDPNPDIIYGFNIGCAYKGLDFSVLASGVAGNQLVQAYRNQVNGYSNYTSAILERWHGEGTSNTVPRVTETNVNYINFSDIMVQDGDYLRISNITLGYDFTKTLIKPTVFKQLRLYATVQNAFTFTTYDGMDPEVGYGVENGSSGIDLGYYPRPRTILLGVNLKF